MSAKKAAQTLLDTIDSGWDDKTLIDEIAEQADGLGLCPADIGLLVHHLEGTEDVRGQVLAMLQKIASTIVYFAESQENDSPKKFLADMILRELSNSYGNGHLPVGVFGPYATEAEAEAAHPGADIWPVSADHIDDLQDFQGRHIAA